MPRRLDIGLASFGSPDLLRQTITSIIYNCVTDWNLIIINNPHPDPKVQAAVNDVLAQLFGGWYTGRITILSPVENIGYAGAVKMIQQTAKTEYIGYVDSDVVLPFGWDERLCSYLDRFHELGMIFPNGGAYQIDRGPYTEILWGVGFCWVMNRLCMTDIGYFDTTLGHQEEVDAAIRVRLAGWKCATAKDVIVQHLARSTNEQSPASIERINRGVVNFMNKWVQYFGGKNINYHSPNVIRFEDWPTTALYLEEWWKQRLPELNANPEIITVEGREYDLIKVPRLHGFYTNRII